MHRGHRAIGAFVAALTVFAATSGWAAESRADCERDFSPRSGQAGKDVIWVPTQEDLVMAMLKAAKVTPDDFVIDLGSGDGRIPIAAAKHFGARAMGIEYNPQMVQLAQCYVRVEGLEDKVTIKQADIFETDFSEATVLTLYLLSDLNMKLRPTILKMKPGTRVVSNSFKMGDWTPDESIDHESGYTRAYLWIVPADVAGTWTFEEEGGQHAFRMTFDQKFQEITVTTAGEGAPNVKEARLRGADLQLTVVDRNDRSQTLNGKVEDDRIVLSGRLNGRTVKYVGRRS
ncbi:MAG: class I SAM-dependent methyltransferase [Gammaproteobacteria bacterium]|nr:class I SAM-dependent methyltransferase [Gammaproteobacteria bacterium]